MVKEPRWHPGAGDGAFLGDMADEEKGGDPGELGLLHQPKGRLSYLVQGAGGRGDSGGVHGLDGIQGQEGGPDLFHYLEDVFQAGLGGHQQVAKGREPERSSWSRGTEV